jgi:hypothetical protein
VTAHRERVNGEVIGFRRWWIGRDLNLLPLSAASRWEPGVQVARCSPMFISGYLATRPQDHAAPAINCDCGIYAHHAREALMDGPWPSYTVGDSWYVEGVIQAWGRLAVHAEGFRAEFARVVALALPEKYETLRFLVPAVARRYGAVACESAELERIAREFGDPVAADLRPRPEPLIDDDPVFPPVRISLGLATPEPGVIFEFAKKYIEDAIEGVTVEEMKED